MDRGRALNFCSSDARVPVLIFTLLLFTPMHPAVVAAIIVGGALFLWSGFEVASHLRNMQSEERREYEAYVRHYYEKQSFSDDEGDDEEEEDDDENDNHKNIFKRMHMPLGFRRRTHRTRMVRRIKPSEI